jgi:hypothetical protein
VAKLARTDQWISSGAVRYRLMGSSQNPVGIELGVDYAKAPVPEHFYVADYLFVEEDQSQIMLTFGKLDRPATDKLRSKVEIYFNPLMFVKQLWATSREFHQMLKKYIEDRGLRPPTWERLFEAPKAQTFQSNQVLMLLTEGESLLDFFYISPKDMYYKPRMAEKLDIEPLVRIILTPELIASFLDSCKPLAEKLTLKYGDKNENLELE